MGCARLLVLASLLPLAACAPQPQRSAAAAPSTAERCISLSAVSGRYASPPNGILFEMVGPLNYRNALAQECRGLDRLGSSAEFVFENPQGGQLCRGDRVRVLDSRATSPIRIQAATLCVLGDFVAVPR